MRPAPTPIASSRVAARLRTDRGRDVEPAGARTCPARFYRTLPRHRRTRVWASGAPARAVSGVRGCLSSCIARAAAVWVIRSCGRRPKAAAAGARGDVPPASESAGSAASSCSTRSATPGRWGPWRSRGSSRRCGRGARERVDAESSPGRAAVPLPHGARTRPPLARRPGAGTAGAQTPGRLVTPRGRLPVGRSGGRDPPHGDVDVRRRPPSPRVRAPSREGRRLRPRAARRTKREGRS